MVEILEEHKIQRELWKYLDYRSASTVGWLFLCSGVVLVVIGLFSLRQIYYAPIVPSIVIRKQGDTRTRATTAGAKASRINRPAARPLCT